MQKSSYLSNVSNLLHIIPATWKWSISSEVCSSVRDGTHDTPKYVTNGLPLITSKNLKEYGIDFLTARNISIQDYEKISIRSGVDRGDVLLAMIGTIGNPVVVNIERKFAIKNVALFKKNEDIIFSKFLCYWLESPLFKKLLEAKYIRGTTQKFIPLQNLRILPIPLPPFNEQKRIVTKLEELLTKLDAGIEYLKKTKILLKQYRQSILKHAFEGKLTEEWRKGNTNLNEETTQLLHKIQNEQKSILQNNKEIQLQSIKSLIQQERPILPQSWKYVHIGDICSRIESGSTPLRSNSSNFDENGILFIKVENILKNGKIVLKDKQLRIHPKIHEKNCRSKVYPGDILMNIVGPPLGKIGFVTSEIKEANINQAIVLMRSVKDYNPKIILYCLLSPSYYKLMVRISTGVRQSNIRKSHVQRILVPLMSIKEQEIIIDTIEKILSIVDKSESTVSLALERGSKFRQTILQYAFEGKLVSQDRNDEPAEILLERIKRERESTIPIKKENSKITKRNSIDKNSRQMRLM